MQASQDGNAGLVELLMSKGANSELNNQVRTLLLTQWLLVTVLCINCRGTGCL